MRRVAQRRKPRAVRQQPHRKGSFSYRETWPKSRGRWEKPGHANPVPVPPGRSQEHLKLQISDPIKSLPSHPLPESPGHVQASLHSTKITHLPSVPSTLTNIVAVPIAVFLVSLTFPISLWLKEWLTDQPLWLYLRASQKCWISGINIMVQCIKLFQAMATSQIGTPLHCHCVFNPAPC